MMDWQPIETAPKDGTRFIAIRLISKGPGDFMDWLVMDGNYQEGRYKFRELISGTPTHWMPLEPPK